MLLADLLKRLDASPKVKLDDLPVNLLGFCLLLVSMFAAITGGLVIAWMFLQAVVVITFQFLVMFPLGILFGICNAFKKR